MKLDIIALVTLVLITGFVAVRMVDFSISPFEDAAMLMRHADHLAHGQGIVWNVGEPPVDGATDFLFLLVVGLLRWIGFSINSAVLLITVISHFVTVCLIYIGMRRVQQSGIIPAFLSALYFAVGPGLFLCAAYLGTPFFTLGVALCWLLAQRLLLPQSRNVSAYISFSAACLAASLIRPEGVLISVFILGAVSILIPRSELRRLISVFASVFLLLGGLYFFWHWSYFGYPLPNPFYKKGGGLLHIDALKSSVRNSLWLGFPFIPFFLLAVRSRQSLRRGIAFLIPIVGATCMWVLISDEMNFGHRFQYPILALYILSWYPLLRREPEDFQFPRFASFNKMQKAAIILITITIIAPIFERNILYSRSITYEHDGRVEIGMMLSKYAYRRYTIATTEAGILPLYSKWRTIDTWGLNDRWIAHAGGLTYEYLSCQKPDVIMWHEYFSPICPPSVKRLHHPWFKMVMTLKKYAEKNNFTLAAVFGAKPDETHYYYVRPDLPEHDEIVDSIRHCTYFWPMNGKIATNYAPMTQKE
ncbi:MAG TPA: hypothetical protein VMT35_20060 [Ignavibacteriaceae bacterium]|nr:hypothetical protein [Ignavibacteriaceae bacterium]